MGIHQDPPWGSTRIHHGDPPGSTMEIHQDPPWGSTKTHYWVQGSTRIHRRDPQGPTTGIHQDPLHGFIRIRYQDLPGSTIEIHKDASPGSTKRIQPDRQLRPTLNHHLLQPKFKTSINLNILLRSNIMQHFNPRDPPLGSTNRIHHQDPSTKFTRIFFQEPPWTKN